jgi:LmbE family N-acetylglucosaminyl deacetylase
MVMSGSDERVVFVLARPGDESLMTGGTIARLRSEGATVAVLFGQAGTEDPSATRKALAELDVNDWMIVPAAAGRSIEDEDRDLDRLLVDMLTEMQATAVVIGTDDDRLRSAGVRAAEKTSTPVFLSRRVAADVNQRVTAIDVSDQIETKIRAIGAYPGRWSVTDHAVQTPDGTLLAVSGTEAFVQIGAAPATGIPHAAASSSSLERIGGGVLAFALGALFGLLGTLAHQATVTIGAIEIPYGLILSLVATSALLIGLRLVLHDRLVVLLCAIGMLGSIFLFSLRSVGGSVLIPQSMSGLIWTIVPTLVAALVIAWPRLPAKR